MNTPDIRPQTKTDEFSELLRCYGDMAYRMAFQITGGREPEARDLVQDGFIKIWRYWRFQRPNSFKGWMYRVLHNLYMDALRYQARRPTLPLHSKDEEGNPIELQVHDGASGPEQDLERKVLSQDVSAALLHLEMQFRIPVVLCDMEGLSYDEIAHIAGCPVGTVRSRIHRGRAQLRALLGQYEKKGAL